MLHAIWLPNEWESSTKKKYFIISEMIDKKAKQKNWKISSARQKLLKIDNLFGGRDVTF